MLRQINSVSSRVSLYFARTRVACHLSASLPKSNCRNTSSIKQLQNMLPETRHRLAHLLKYLIDCSHWCRCVPRAVPSPKAHGSSAYQNVWERSLNMETIE